MSRRQAELRLEQQDADAEAAFSDRTLYLLGEGAAQKIPDSPMTPTTSLAGSEHSRIDGGAPAARVAALQPGSTTGDKSIGHGQSNQKAERLGSRVEINNPYLAAARMKKAEAIIAILQKHSISAEQAEGMTDRQWEIAAKAARVNVPSVDTQRLVVDALRRAEQISRAS